MSSSKSIKMVEAKSKKGCGTFGKQLNVAARKFVFFINMICYYLMMMMILTN